MAALVDSMVSAMFGPSCDRGGEWDNYLVLHPCSQVDGLSVWSDDYNTARAGNTTYQNRHPTMFTYNALESMYIRMLTQGEKRPAQGGDDYIESQAKKLIHAHVMRSVVETGATCMSLHTYFGWKNNKLVSLTSMCQLHVRPTTMRAHYNELCTRAAVGQGEVRPLWVRRPDRDDTEGG